VLEVFRNASTSPALIETADGARWVMKFSGAGSGPFGLLTEFVALGIARALGAPVPAAQPVWLRGDFPWQAGTDEFDAMLQRSSGWNLAIAYVPNALAVVPADLPRLDPAALDAIARSDAVVQNVDRTARNPNLLIAQDRLWAIDYDACLYLSRALGPPRPPVLTLPGGHLLAGREPVSRVPTIEAARLLAGAPNAWVAAAGTDRAGLGAALGRYLAAYQ
jgi:hypothetical protein